MPRRARCEDAPRMARIVERRIISWPITTRAVAIRNRVDVGMDWDAGGLKNRSRNRAFQRVTPLALARRARYTSAMTSPTLSPPPTLQRRIGLWSAIAVVIG